MERYSSGITYIFMGLSKSYQALCMLWLCILNLVLWETEKEPDEDLKWSFLCKRNEG